MNLDEQIRTAYDAFIKAPINPVFGVYEYKEGEVLIRVFDFMEKKKLNIDLNDGGTSSNDRLYRRFPIGQVIASGPVAHKTDTQYAPGDIVRLSDADHMMYSNPLAKGYVNNEARNSNLTPAGFNLDGTKVTGELPTFKTDFVRTHGRHHLAPDPIVAVASHNIADYVYFVTNHQRVRKINNPSIFGMDAYKVKSN